MASPLIQDSWCPLLVHSIPPGAYFPALDIKDTDKSKRDEKLAARKKADQGKERKQAKCKTK